MRGAEEAAEGGVELARGHGPEICRAQAEQAEAGSHHVGPGKGKGDELS